MVRKGVAYVTVNVPQVCLSPGLLVLWCGTAGKGNDAEGDTRQGDTREVALGHCRAFQNAASVCLSGRVATRMDGGAFTLRRLRIPPLRSGMTSPTYAGANEGHPSRYVGLAADSTAANHWQVFIYDLRPRPSQKRVFSASC